uniref:Uncharacterized protein n=1 Tax=Hucho hucho TaxID=62062 RepID=A0A4W5RXQ6_9TELE
FAGPPGKTTDSWKRHIIRQLKHRDKYQKAMFQDPEYLCVLFKRQSSLDRRVTRIRPFYLLERSIEITVPISPSCVHQGLSSSLINCMVCSGTTTPHIILLTPHLLRFDGY